MNRTFNKSDVEELFEKNCVLVGTKNVMPMQKAIELFGKEAVQFAKRRYPIRNGSIYGNGKNDLHYLTKEGLFHAATFNNIEALAAVYGTDPEHE